MKKFRLLAAVLVGAVAFNACKDDNNATPQAFVMQVNEPVGAYAEAEVNSLVPVNITATSSKGIIAFDATVAYEDSTYDFFSMEVDTITDFDYTDTLLVPNTKGNVVYAFTAMDSDSATVTKKVTVKIINQFSTGNGQVWNIQGTNTSAWDFVGDSAVATIGDSLVKDIVDNSSSSTAVIYDATWVSGNGTTFVIDNNLSFDANLTQIAAAYEAGTEVENTGTLAAGNMVICKNSRFPKGYVLVEVTNVDDTTILNDDDSISFRYKK